MKSPFLASEAAPSAPPLSAPVLLSEKELAALQAQLQAAYSQSTQSFEEQRRLLRTELFGRVLHHGQASRLLQAIDPEFRGFALRELYELQFIIESREAGQSFAAALAAEGNMGLPAVQATALRNQIQATAAQALHFMPEGTTLPDGFDASALPSAPPAEFSIPPASAPPPEPGSVHAVTVMRFDGQIVTVVGDSATLTVANALTSTSQQLGVATFDPLQHYAVMVWPGRRHLDVSQTVAKLGIPCWARILWLERKMPTSANGQAVDPRSAGLRFEKIRSTFFGQQNFQMHVSKGELRNFLWNLNLDDSAFARLWQRLDTRGHGFLDIDDLLHLVGRAHMQHPSVPIDALIYEAATLILRPKPEVQEDSHFDLDVASLPGGLGFGEACGAHGCSYVFSFLLQIAVVVLFVMALGTPDHDESEQLGQACVITYIVYLIHCFCCSRFGSAVYNRVTGLDAVCDVMERPKTEDPHYSWTLQNYHYETRTTTESYTDSEGKSKTRTVTKTVRVDTGPRFYRQGRIPSVDRTATFVPDTSALTTEIDTDLSLDFSHSNYLQCYDHWRYSHRWDIHQDEHRTEWLPTQKAAVLAEWVSGTRPCWMRTTFYAFSSLFLCSCCFRLGAQMRCGQQSFTYRKKCYRIDYEPPSGGHRAAARFLGGLIAGMEIASAINRGAYVW
mmetsp:Transcript_89856/g.159859  ORF Transcript_89856/g.159859 Transcript_89856/m.159859 type:complete len:674 (+) Transcript_89856:58-2079(+)